MTQDRFLRMLGDPNLLATISYQELKTLALAYPYAHNLRYLLALKAQQDNHPEFSNTLAAAAAHSLYRPQLFQLVAPQRVGMIEEVLELKAIEALRLELEARAPLVRQAEKTPEPRFEAIARPPAETVPAEETEPGVEMLSSEDFSPDLVDASAPRPFSEWLDQFNLPLLAPRTRRVVVSLPEAGDPADAAPKPLTLAERSVTPKDEVVSETMARLFAAQGHRDKAIELYERLRLAFPEKSDYFAAEIDKLKK